MQVRLAYSIAIQVDFDILLLDEVLAVGDQAFQVKCFATFDRFREEGKTVVFVSHDLGSVARFCDRALLLEGGLPQTIGPPDAGDRCVSTASRRASMSAETVDWSWGGILPSSNRENASGSRGKRRWS